MEVVIGGMFKDKKKPRSVNVVVRSVEMGEHEMVLILFPVDPIRDTSFCGLAFERQKRITFLFTIIADSATVRTTSAKTRKFP